MKKSILTMAIALCASTSAAANVEIKPKDNSIESNICAIAGEQGIEQAKVFAQSQGLNFQRYTYNLTCNGMSLKSFSRKYTNTQPISEPEAITKTISLVAKNNNDASKVCIEAVLLGEDVARANHNMEAEPIYCNAKPLRTFVSMFESRNVIANQAQ